MSNLVSRGVVFSKVLNEAEICVQLVSQAAAFLCGKPSEALCICLLRLWSYPKRTTLGAQHVSLFFAIRCRGSQTLSQQGALCREKAQKAHTAQISRAKEESQKAQAALSEFPDRILM